MDHIIRQIHFRDEFNPKKLQFIAQHFQVGNSRACAFCLYYIYDLQSFMVGKISREHSTASKTIFMHFTQGQINKANKKAASYGISFGELCKRAILEVSTLIEKEKMEPYHPKVLEFFKD